MEEVMSVSAKMPEIAHQRSKRGVMKITSKFAESAREKASRNRIHLRKFICQTVVGCNRAVG
jgi:hypothetical protein